MNNKALKTKNKHGKHALERDDVLTLAPDALMEALLNREQVAMPEERVLNTVLRWTLHRPQERQQHLSSLMRAVRLSLVPRETLVARARLEPLVTTPRALLQIIEELAEAQDPQPHDASLLVMGGLKGVSRIHDTNTVFVYNAATDSWSTGPPMTTARISPGVVALAGRLYAVGGRTKQYSSHISVETLDPREGVWRPIAPLTTPRHGLGVAVLDGMLYAIGGYIHYTSMNSVERYDPAANTWETVEAMVELKGDVGVATLDDAIYAVGGWNGSTMQRSVERYRAESGWECLPPMSKAVGHAAATAHGGILYLVGGHDDRKRLTTVKVFDTATNAWSQLPAALPASRLCAAAVVLPWPLQPSTL